MCSLFILDELPEVEVFELARSSNELEVAGDFVSEVPGACGASGTELVSEEAEENLFLQKSKSS
jgi:hypothetical protein